MDPDEVAPTQVPHPPAADDQHGAIAVVIPIKAFDIAKERLAEVLSSDRRAELAQTMAATVLAAARPLPVFVVCGDETVARWATELGAEVLWLAEPGLNRAVDFATSTLTPKGFARVAIVHGDLPRATDVASAVVPSASDDPATVLIVTDRRADGTNVLSVPTGRGFTFHYGVGSAAHHRAEAERLGLPVRFVDDVDLAWDVDTPDDLLDQNGSDHD